MRYLPHTNKDIDEMLSIIGKPNIKSLFDSIPRELILEHHLKIPYGIDEQKLKKELLDRSSFKFKTSFLGAGAVRHFVPEIVSQLLLRSEWYTSYTPYQAEASQGTLQTIFEFQTIVSSIFGCNIANASMYDGSTALAEACLMAKRVKPKTNTILLSKGIHPEYRDVCATYLNAVNIEIIEIDFNKNGLVNMKHLDKLLLKRSDNITAIVYQTPNFFGQLEEQKQIIDLSHKHNILIIAVNTDPLIFALVKSPGSLGADIVVSEGISFCGHLSLGAPGLGLFASLNKYIRQMPGRLVSKAIDSNNNTAFILTLSTREQHIRRERATSNICTNHNLMALAFTISLSLYGKVGFYNVAIKNLQRTIYFRRASIKAGLKIKFNGPHFNESVIKFSSQNKLQQKVDYLATQKIFAGCELHKWYSQFNDCLLVNTTELCEEKDIDELVNGLR
jgi:glycine dehydrogenase subunit 1